MNVRDFPIFKGLSDTQIENFLGACSEVSFAPEEIFIHEGERGGDVFFLTEGSVRVFITRDGRGQELAQVNAPCVLGEMEFLSGKERGASVAGCGASKGFKVSADTLQRRLDDGDGATLKVIFNISRVLAHRLNAMNRRLADFVENPGAHRSEDLKEFQKKLLADWSF